MHAVLLLPFPVQLEFFAEEYNIVIVPNFSFPGRSKLRGFAVCGCECSVHS
jgi:hypothetical protein